MSQNKSFIRHLAEIIPPLLLKLSGVFAISIGAIILEYKKDNFADSFQAEVRRIHPELKFESMSFSSGTSFVTFDAQLDGLSQLQLTQYRDAIENDVRQIFCAQYKSSKQQPKFQVFNVNVQSGDSQNHEFLLASSIFPSTCS